MPTTAPIEPAAATPPAYLECPCCTDGYVCWQACYVGCRCPDCRRCEECCGQNLYDVWNCAGCDETFRVSEGVAPANLESNGEHTKPSEWRCDACMAPARVAATRASVPALLADTRRIVAIADGQMTLDAGELGQVLGLARSIEQALVELAAQVTA